MKVYETIKIFCNSCRNETNHEIRCDEQNVETVTIPEEDGTETTYTMCTVNEQIAFCKGCNLATFRTIQKYPESFILENNNLVLKHEYELITILPERKKNLHIEKRIQGTPKKIQLFYRELVDTLNNDCHNMYVVGLRHIIEMIVGHFIVDQKDINCKMDDFVKTGLISYDLSESLKAIYFRINDAYSCQEELDKSEKIDFLEIVEFAMESSFSAPIRSNELKSRITKHLLKSKN